ncbi:MAG TPA: FixH family protein [Steroidobacteraceae bacterium]|nr:FixH family protein [Steroidobacteraceae bacterium]
MSSRVAVAALVVAACVAKSQAQTAPPLPELPGKDLVTQHCAGACHELQRIQESGGSHAEWIVRIRRMIRRGAIIPGRSIEPLATYLATALPPRAAGPAVDAHLITTTVGEVAIRPIQTWVRTAGLMQNDEQTVVAKLSVREAALLKPGQRARAFALGSRSSMYQGRIDRVTLSADTSQVSVRLATAARAGAYLLEIIAEQEPVLSIPNEAIIEEGDRRIAYVEKESGDFEPRTIATGLQGEVYTQVTNGLSAGEQVVTFGSFFIDAEQKMKSTSPSMAPGADSIMIEYRSAVDPPHEGDNDVQVTVRRSNGEPLTEGEVTLSYYMAAMPTMNMPEMRDVFSLANRGAGTYAGIAHLRMSGTWTVTVSVSERGKQIGKKDVSIIAK